MTKQKSSFMQAPAFLRWLVVMMIVQLVVEFIDLAEVTQYMFGMRFYMHLLTWILGFIFRMYLIEGLLSKWYGIRMVTLYWNAVIFIWLSRALFELPHNYYNLVANSLNYFHAMFTLAVSATAIYVMVRPDIKKYLSQEALS